MPPAPRRTPKPLAPAPPQNSPARRTLPAPTPLSPPQPPKPHTPAPTARPSPTEFARGRDTTSFRWRMGRLRRGVRELLIHIAHREAAIRSMSCALIGASRQGRGEGDECAEQVGVAFAADGQAAIYQQPGDRAFDLPSACRAPTGAQALPTPQSEIIPAEYPGRRPARIAGVAKSVHGHCAWDRSAAGRGTNPPCDRRMPVCRRSGRVGVRYLGWTASKILRRSSGVTPSRSSAGSSTTCSRWPRAASRSPRRAAIRAATR